MAGQATVDRYFVNSQSKPLLFRYGQELTAVAIGDPCFALIEDKELASLLLAQSAHEDSVSARLFLIDVTYLRARRDKGQCRKMARVAIYESDGQWVAEDTAAHEIIPEPAQHPYPIVFISKEDYERLQSFIAQETIGPVLQFARGFVKTLPQAEDMHYGAKRRWALTLIERATEALRREHTLSGEQAAFDALHVFLTEHPAPGSSKEVAVRLNVTENTVRMRVHRLRRRFGELLRREIADTMDKDAELDEEMRHLFDLWNGPPPGRRGTDPSAGTGRQFP